MSRREVKMYWVWGLTSMVVTCGTLVVMYLLGAGDQVMVVGVIVAFVLMMLVGGLLPADPPPKRR
jgi:hypothetical protein